MVRQSRGGDVVEGGDVGVGEDSSPGARVDGDLSLGVQSG